MKWEYRVETSEIGDYKGADCTAPFVKKLNNLGKEGWEAVGAGIDKVTSYTRPIVVLLKRPVQFH